MVINYNVNMGRHRAIYLHG